MQKINLCQLPKLGLSCFGCCGNTYTTKEDILVAIEKNTLEFGAYQDPREFMNRSKDLRACGICRNIIYLDKNVVGCPIHPDQLKGEDIRVGHCDTKYKCTAKKLFDGWDKKTQQKFLKYLNKLKDDGMGWFEYSIGMDDDSILESFLETKNHKN